MRRSNHWQLFLIWGTIISAAAALGYFLFSPAAVRVETALVRRTTLEVVVEDDGRTRIREKYVISANVAGRLSRLELHPGDAVTANLTPIARIDPAPPALLDERSRIKAEAQVEAAKTQQVRAATQRESASSSRRIAQEESERLDTISERGSITHEERDRAELRFQLAINEERSALLLERIAQFELQQAQAALLHLSSQGSAPTSSSDDWRMTISSPIDGVVLRVFQESEAIVEPGTSLLEVGDPKDLEAVVDVLSSDAVRIRSGMNVEFDHWGGNVELHGVVRRVEPSAFLKVSAIGVEEQRVNVVIDFIGDPDARSALGDDFRVDARIIVDRADNVILAPPGAVFHFQNGSAVFVAVGQRAELHRVTTGRVGRDGVEILSGLREGERVIVYPGDKVAHGVRIEEFHQVVN